MSSIYLHVGRPQGRTTSEAAHTNARLFYEYLLDTMVKPIRLNCCCKNSTTHSTNRFRSTAALTYLEFAFVCPTDESGVREGTQHLAVCIQSPQYLFGIVADHLPQLFLSAVRSGRHPRCRYLEFNCLKRWLPKRSSIKSLYSACTDEQVYVAGYSRPVSSATSRCGYGRAFLHRVSVSKGLFQTRRTVFRRQSLMYFSIESPTRSFRRVSN
jgi:hypothetical protein